MSRLSSVKVKREPNFPAKGTMNIEPNGHSLLMAPSSTWPRISGCGWEGSNTDILSYTNQERNPSIASDHGYCRSLSKGTGEKQKPSVSCVFHFSHPISRSWHWEFPKTMKFLVGSLVSPPFFLICSSPFFYLLVLY